MNKKHDLKKIIQAAIDAGDNCILWSGCISNGYGRITIKGESRGLHTVVYELISGERVQYPYTVDHICRVRNCYSFNHLRKATYSEQNRNRGCYTKPKKSICINGHDLNNPSNIKLRRNGVRRCILCDKLRNDLR